MRHTSRIVRRLCVLAGAIVIGASAQAMSFSQQITIDRALNSPTLTVRYSHANAAIVELLLNGESLGTRSVSAAKSSGETNFTLDLAMLKEGDNEVEVRLFDRTGKVVGTEKNTISSEQSNQGPVFVAAPKVGSTVQGPVEIKVGFGRTLRNTYVSFFVDSNFKSMSNFPPFNYVWDTERETNGWHEIEAWAIDDTSATYKTRKIRVFVNNPGGRTDRPGAGVDLTMSTNPVKTSVSGVDAGMKAVGNVGASAVMTHPAGLPPAIHATGTPSTNAIRAAMGSMSGTKAIVPGSAIATGLQHMTPTGTRLAHAAVKNAAHALNAVHPRGLPPAVVGAVKTAAHLVPITKGQHIPNLGAFAVVFDSQAVHFDVQPRVDDGVPMTPFRYLIEKGGGSVSWENLSKSVNADADGHKIFLQIGDKDAKINDAIVSLELAPYLDHGRTIVPLSFIRDALNVNVEYDKDTNHVLITRIKN